MPPRSLILAWLEENAIFLTCCSALLVGFIAVGSLLFSSGAESTANGADQNRAPKPVASSDASEDGLAALPPVPAAPEKVSTKDAWLNTLTGLEYAPWDQAEPQILEALQAADREVRLRAVSLLVGAKDNPAMLPLLAAAQNDVDPEVRRDAIGVLENSSLKERLTPYLFRASADVNEEVRGAAIQAAWSLPPDQRDEFIGQAVNSGWDDVSSAAFEMLKHEYSTQTVNVLLNAYATDNPSQINRANEVMNTLLNQTFANGSEAAAWWSQHRSEYGDDLSLKTTESDSTP